MAEMTKKISYLPHALVLLAGVAWGVSGFFTRRLSALGLSPIGMVIVRNLGAALILGLVLLIAERAAFRIRLRHLPLFVAMGLVSVLAFSLIYFRSQQVNSLALAAILLYTAPAFVVLLSALLFRDRITGRKLIALVLSFGGCVLASGLIGGRVELDPGGLLLGLGSGLLYASYTIFARFVTRHYSAMTVTFYTFVTAACGALVLWLLGDGELSAVSWTGETAVYLAGLVLIPTVAPYLLYTKGMAGLGDGGKASILASIEPVIAALTGVLAFGEPLGPGVLGGLACILISVVILG